MGFECEICSHKCPTLDLIKEHMIEHEEEFFSECFDVWADDYIIEEDDD